MEFQSTDVPPQGWGVGKDGESCEKTFDVCFDLGQLEHRDVDDSVGASGIGDELEAHNACF